MKIIISLLLVLSPIICTYAQSVSYQTISLPASIGEYTHSIMSIENDILYIPTSKGLYKINVLNMDEGFTLAGFEGANLIECIHKDNEWLALTRNSGNNILLRSIDGGETFQDNTPYHLFPGNPNQTALRLCQDPSNKNVVYLLSNRVGIMKSEDFGKSWTVVSIYVNHNPTYCGFEVHPLDSRIILQHGENFAMQPSLAISYDGGQQWSNTWDYYPNHEISLPKLPTYAENCIHDVAFHPTDVNVWIFGGEGVIAKSYDRGKTWEHKADSWGYHYCTLFDYSNPNNIFSIGVNNWEQYHGYNILISNDCGENWKSIYIPTELETYYHDVKQDDDRFFILCNNDLVIINKRELINLAAIESITTDEVELLSNSNLYTVDGRLLIPNASDNDISMLSPGIYIYKRKKIVIK